MHLLEKQGMSSYYNELFFTILKSKLMKIDFSNRLKNFLFNNNLTIPDVATKTGLSVNTVKNILYGRSHRKEYVVKIAESYNIPIEYFIDEKITDYEIDTYNIIVDIIINCLRLKNITRCSKSFLDNLVIDGYKQFSSNKLDQREVEIYIYGQIDSAINHKLIIQESKKLDN